MRKLLGVAAAALLTASVGARAADLPPVAAAAPVPLFDWNGPYVGAHFAWSLGRAHDTYFNGTQPLPIARDSFRGPFGGVEVGYCGMRVSPVVLCGEVEADFGRARGTNYAFTTLATNTNISSTTTIDWRVTVGPKLGLAIDQNRLFIYATGGGAIANVGSTRPRTSSAGSVPAARRGRVAAGSSAPAWSGCSRPISASSSSTGTSRSAASTPRSPAAPR
jgi:opacity protein-like surface antigen